MKLIVGLGNPGPDYETTRHNVGFWVIDAFSARHNVPLLEKRAKSRMGRGSWVVSSPSDTKKIDFLLVQPQTFMNRSGIAVRQLLSEFKIDLADLIVIQDDLDMDCGRTRIRTKGSAGGHRGIASVIELIGSDQFVRLKIGIGRSSYQEVTDYVLTPFSKAEKPAILDGVERSVTVLPLLLEGKLTEAMNRYNVPTGTTN
jgi:PTH1 family peptidyl-tRNA hydrolase